MTRNPRRAYDAEWREIEPMSLPPCASTGWATCEDCKHKAIINLDSLPDRLYVPDVALRLRCSACGSKKIATRRREIPVPTCDVLRKASESGLPVGVA